MLGCLCYSDSISHCYGRWSALRHVRLLPLRNAASNSRLEPASQSNVFQPKMKVLNTSPLTRANSDHQLNAWFAALNTRLLLIKRLIISNTFIPSTVRFERRMAYESALGSKCP